MMDNIERSITLPPNALPLDSYARYYTDYRGSIHGAYTTVVEGPRAPGEGCTEMQADGPDKPVACAAVADVRPGDRRWVEFEDYPAVSGMDCAAIQLEFDPVATKFTYLACADDD